ncbi:uncharacterized protein TNCV_3706511 [Trichonephila clavipes]|nr:uncharacterized protein TNCV_3706511 [Trichonephila clavipes]
MFVMCGAHVKEIGVLDISFAFPLPTLRCRRAAWRYLSSVSPEKHCCRVSAADKGWRVYPLDPHLVAVAFYSGYTPGKRRVRFLPDDRHTASYVGLRGEWKHARTLLFSRLWIQCSCSWVKALYYPTLTLMILPRKLDLSFLDNGMFTKSPFAINKFIIGISGEPKSVKRLRSSDPLLKTRSTLQTKPYLLVKFFLDSPVMISPLKTLNSCRDARSESDVVDHPRSRNTRWIF